MTSYTSGPWKVVGSYISAPSWEGFCKVYRLESDADVAESDANARLIAHAPELVEALEAIERDMTICDNENDCVGEVFQVWLTRKQLEQARDLLAAIRGDA
jgi:crotonobetainyl-CoA:carnitine CoA-transferase CaiB-like acyl-CoA transferase